MKSEYFRLFLNDNKFLSHRIKNKKFGHNIKGGGGAFKESLGRGVPPSPSNPNLVSDKNCSFRHPF